MLLFEDGISLKWQQGFECEIKMIELVRMYQGCDRFR
jgi:hypothetical protein